MTRPDAQGFALDLRHPLRPRPAPSIRPWAGRRLGAGGVGELWLAGPDSAVPVGDGRSVSLDRLAEIHGAALIGRNGLQLVGSRFPLLVKIIDAAAWLSLQVHPSDEVAAALCGPDCLGKTEAWLVLDAPAGGELITGHRRDLAEDELRAAVGSGTLDRPHCSSAVARPGDAYLIPAGTIHAIGAGLLVYEIEQPSDLTYRISDWGRPPTPGRVLHTRQALRAVVPGSQAVPAGQAFVLDGGALEVREFRLEIVSAARVERHPDGRSLEVVTAVGGQVEIAGDGWQETLHPFQALVVPAAVPGYALAARAGARALVGSVP